MSKGVIGLLLIQGLENVFSSSIKANKKRKQKLQIRIENLKNEKKLLRLEGGFER